MVAAMSAFFIEGEYRIQTTEYRTASAGDEALVSAHLPGRECGMAGAEGRVRLQVDVIAGRAPRAGGAPVDDKMVAPHAEAAGGRRDVPAIPIGDEVLVIDGEQADGCGGSRRALV